jgi:hypothetical protein
VEYLPEEPFTYQTRRWTWTRAVRDLGHKPLIALAQGISQDLRLDARSVRFSSSGAVDLARYL